MSKFSHLHIALKTSLWACFGLWVLTGCSVSKYIPEGEYLYTGGDLRVEYPKDEATDKTLNNALSQAIYPKPNSTFLRMRVGLWAFYKVENDRAGLISNYLNKKYGEEPVYISDVKLRETEELLENRCINRGHFFPEIKSGIDYKKHKAKAWYVAKVHEPYRLESYTFLVDSISPADSIIAYSLEESSLIKGAKFDLANFKAERRRIDQYLKLRGFYFFNEEYLIFKTDTNQYERKGFDLYLSLKTNAPRAELVPYKLNSVSFLSRTSGSDSLSTLDSATNQGISFKQYPQWVVPKYLSKHIVTMPDSTYNRDYARNTVRRLSSLEAYQHANIRFVKPDSASNSSNSLNARINVTPANKYNIRTGVHGVTKSTGFTGPGLVVTFQNRNVFKGAEVLEIQGVAGYEFQISRGSSSGLNNFELRLENSLSFPRLLAPLIKVNPFKAYSIPNTRVKLNFNFQQRALYYSVNSLFTSFGYDWYSNAQVRWEFTPLSLNYMRVYNRTPEFEDILEENPFLARSFDDQFIPATSGGFRYNEMQLTRKSNLFFVGINLEQAGFLIGNVIGRDSLLGEVYAQYLKTDIDFRFMHKIDKEREWVNRIFLGIGMPYGNSQSLPYIKQYFSGGPNSLRAFQVRSLGPGSFVPEQIDDNSFFDQAGDIRIEFNTEYRFPLISYLKGAVFVDVGNVWLWNDNPSLPGGQISSNWYNDLAAGAGVGFRFDAQVLVVRLDVAHPLLYPSDQFREFWQNDLSLGQVVWNFAIGYPF